MNIDDLKKIGNPRVVFEPDAGENLNICIEKCLQFAIFNFIPVELAFNCQRYYIDPTEIFDFIHRKAHKA